MDLRRTRSTENLLQSTETADLAPSGIDGGIPSLDQDSVAGTANDIDSVLESKKHDIDLHQEVVKSKDSFGKKE